MLKVLLKNQNRYKKYKTTIPVHHIELSQQNIRVCRYITFYRFLHCTSKNLSAQAIHRSLPSNVGSPTFLTQERGLSSLSSLEPSRLLSSFFCFLLTSKLSSSSVTLLFLRSKSKFLICSMYGNTVVTQSTLAFKSANTCPFAGHPFQRVHLIFHCTHHCIQQVGPNKKEVYSSRNLSITK